MSERSEGREGMTKRTRVMSERTERSEGRTKRAAS